MAEKKATSEDVQPPSTGEKGVPAKTVPVGKNAPAHKSDGSEMLLFSSSDHGKQPPPKGAPMVVEKPGKAGDGKGEMPAGKVAGNEEGGKTTAMITALAATAPAFLTAPQVDSPMPLPSDYVQFFVNPNEQVLAAAEPVTKQATEPHTATKKTEKSKHGVKQAAKDQQQPVTKPEEIQTIHSSDGVKPRIIKCRNGVPESLIKAIKEYMDKQK